MSTDRSNSAPTVAEHLARAKVLYDEGIDKHRQCVEEILAAREVDQALSDRAIGKALDISHTTVARLLRWHEAGAARTTPFGGDETDKRAERAFRKALRDRPPVETLTELLTEHPSVVDDLLAGTYDDSEPEPVTDPTLQYGDTVVMEAPDWPTCVIACGRSDHAFIGGNLRHFADLYSKPVGAPLNCVILSDQPFGMNKPGVSQDHYADRSDTWNQLPARGGVVIVSAEWNLLREAAAGVERSGYDIKYGPFILVKGGAQWLGKKWRNEYDAALYFERRGEPVWAEGRRACPLIWPDLTRAAMDDRARIARGHKTPKHLRQLTAFIELTTQPGDTVLDPFAGSGTTMIAALRSGRRFLGVELEPQWAEAIVRNYIDETGGTATVHPIRRDAAYQYGEPRP